MERRRRRVMTSKLAGAVSAILAVTVCLAETPAVHANASCTSLDVPAIIDIHIEGPWNHKSSATKKSKALEEFRKANDEFESLNYALAEAGYTRAIELWPHPAFFYNRAMTQLKLQYTLEAYRSLVSAVRSEMPAALGLDAKGTCRYNLALNTIKQLKKELAAVTISCPAPYVTVTIDGKPLKLDALGRYRGVQTPGWHDFKCGGSSESTAYKAHEEHLYQSRGENKPIELTPRLWVPVSRSQWPGVTMTAIGAASLGAAVFLRIRTGQLNNELDTEIGLKCPVEGCEPAPLTPDEAAELDAMQTRRNLYGTLTVIGYSTAGVALAAAAYLFYRSRERTVEVPVRGPGDIPNSMRKRINLSPHVTRNGMGITVGAQF